MRQTDSLSFVSQYFNNKNSFFNPQLFNLANENAKAASEFPIIYYLTALIYQIVGNKPFILKLIHLIISYVGVYYIFKLCYMWLKDYFYASLITLFLFTSTVFNYYSFNYLPDISALGFTFIGWYFAFKYLSTPTKKSLLIGLLFFTLASLIKVTYFLNPIALIVFILFSYLKKSKSDKEIKIKPVVIFGLISVFLVLSWNLYMIYYNKINASSSFIYYPLPIWNLSSYEISQVWEHMSDYWYASYFAHSSFHFLFAIILLQILFIKKSDFKLSGIITILLIGMISYYLLFYSQFKVHDYYFLAFIPLFILMLINGISILQKLIKKKFFHYLVKIALLIIVISGINYSKMKLEDRYDKRINSYSSIGFLIDENKNAIEELDIKQSAKFIVAPDKTPNGGLFFLNRMGWTIKDSNEITVENIAHFKQLGAEYLLIASENQKTLSKGEQAGEKIFDGKGISIFKLD